MTIDFKSDRMWFCVSLLFRAHYSDEKMNDCPLWEESILAISAESEDDARTQAQAMGKKKELFYVSNGVDVTWKFAQVERIFHVDDEEIVNGTELFSRFLRDSEVKSLLTPFDD